MVDTYSLGRRIGITLRRLRERQGLTQKQLAEAMGISRPQLALIENGDRNRKMNLEVLRKGALHLGLPGLGRLISWAEGEEIDVE